MHKRENGGTPARQGRGIGNGRRFPGRRCCCPVWLAVVEYTHEMAFLWNEIAGTCSDSGQDTRNRRLCDIDFAETPAANVVAMVLPDMRAAERGAMIHGPNPARRRNARLVVPKLANRHITRTPLWRIFN